MKTHGYSRTDDTDRAARVARVIESVTASRLRGANVSDEQIIAEYPDLMPELAEELRELAGVLEARRRAGETADQSGEADARGGGDADRSESDLDETTAASPAKTLSDSLPGYTIVREIHRGGQGVVYQALQRSTNRKVAIKVMKEGPFAGPADKARFEREAHILGQLKHPNIVTIHDSGSAAGVHYFVMDYISGQPLDVYMAGAGERGPLARNKGATKRRSDEGKGGRGSRRAGETAGATGLSVESTLRLFGKICEAVNAAHLHGVIHRDLKPGNIRIDAEGQPHLLDFGLAKVALSGLTGGDAHPTQAMTMTGQFVGSLPWASPEQAEAAPGKIDVRTDVYSLGVILYQMLTGKFPYEVVGNMRDVLDRIMEAEPARPSTVRKQINDEVETIVLKCLSKERVRRYQTAGVLAEDIKRYLAGEPIEAKRDSGWYVLRKHLARYRVPVATAAAFVLLLIGATATSTVFYFRAEEQRRQAHEAATRESQQRRIADAEATRADKEKAVAEAVNEFLTKDLLAAVAPSPEAGQGKDVLMRDVLDQAAERIEEASRVGGRFEKMPLVEASTRATLGSTYYLLGEYVAAEPHLERARLLRRRELGEEHPHTLNSMNNLAILYMDQGRYHKAEPLYAKTLEIQKRVLGEEHPDTLKSMNNLAALYRNQGRYDEAEPLYVKTLKIQKRVLGEEHPHTLASMGNLAILYGSQGRYDEAEPLYVKTLEIKKRVLGEEHPRTLRSMNNLALLYKGQGRYDDAEPLYVKTLEIMKRVLGEEHPNTLRSMNNLATLYGDQGRMDDARPLVRALQEARRRRIDRPGASASAKNGLAWNLLTCEPADLRDPETALRLARDACAMTDNVNPAYLDTLALAQHLTGDTPAAIETEKKALSLLAPDAPGRGDYEAALAKFEAAQKEAETAEKPAKSP